MDVSSIFMYYPTVFLTLNYIAIGYGEVCETEGHNFYIQRDHKVSGVSLIASTGTSPGLLECVAMCIKKKKYEGINFNGNLHQCECIQASNTDFKCSQISSPGYEGLILMKPKVSDFLKFI